MKKSIVVMLVVGLMLISFSESFAKKRNNRNNRNFNRGEQIVKLLKLTDTQLVKFNELRFAHQANIIDIEAKIEKHRLAVQKMMVTTGKVNEAKLLEVTGDISGFRGQLFELRTKNWLTVYKMLNDDQKVIWKDNFQRMRGQNNNGFRDGSRRNGMGNRDGSSTGLMRNQRSFRNN
ncbi:MAG: hypothetical protein GY936_16075 [Ignavibacteriae bacterium]|nr:hypothetical protein [Ignavibacteriota bacterium]